MIYQASIWLIHVARANKQYEECGDVMASHINNLSQTKTAYEWHLNEAKARPLGTRNYYNHQYSRQMSKGRNESGALKRHHRSLHHNESQ